jgi:hypothetical protein
MAEMGGEWRLRPMTHAKVWNDRGEPVLVRIDTIDRVFSVDGHVVVVVSSRGYNGRDMWFEYDGGDVPLSEWEELLCAPRREKETA